LLTNRLGAIWCHSTQMAPNSSAFT
jgi:hypothetical protein